MSNFERIGPRNRVENIEADEVKIIEDFCTAVQEMPARQQLEAIRDFLRNNLLNAMKPGAKIPPEVISRVWDQKTLKAVSTILSDRYGVCLDWHVVGQVLLNKLGIETRFQVGAVEGGPKHTYLDVKIDGMWEIFDPFAEQYLEDSGQKGTLFQPDYYLNSNAYLT